MLPLLLGVQLLLLSVGLRLATLLRRLHPLWLGLPRLLRSLVWGLVWGLLLVLWVLLLVLLRVLPMLLVVVLGLGLRLRMLVLVLPLSLPLLPLLLVVVRVRLVLLCLLRGLHPLRARGSSTNRWGLGSLLSVKLLVCILRQG